LETITLIQALRSTLLDLETGERGYVITGQAAYLLPYQQAREQLANKHEQLTKILTLTQSDARSLETFDGLIAHRVKIAEDNIAVRESDGLEATVLRLLAAGGRQTTDQLRSYLDTLEEGERERLHELSQYADLQAQRSRWMWGLGAALIALLLMITGASMVSKWRHRQRMVTMQQTFVSSVSHELRTPLTAICGALGMLQSGYAGEISPDAQRLIEMANHNGKRLAHLIDDILDIEKLESGQLMFHWQVVELKPLILQSVEANQPFATSFSVSLTLGAAVETLNSDERVEVDPVRFAQVMANLISNACKHSPPGASVEISAQQVENRWLEVSVTDEGSGIPWSFQSRVFERFAQADGSDRRRTGGTGLGLAITKSLVEEMRGSIGFRSAPSHGSCFYVRLPKVIVE
ncbi:unnamed protein product, partial [Ectocarpus sp. 12 AP-2014]